MWKRKSKPEQVQEAYLPETGQIDNGFRKGRSVFEGYRRGVGLEFGELRRIITWDPDFRNAIGIAEGRTVVSKDRLMNLFVLIKFFLPKLGRGHIIEFGSYNGGSALFMAHLAQRFLPDTRIFALDTFAGMPATEGSVDAHVEGDFITEPLPNLLSLKNKMGLSNLEFVQGRFADTASDVLLKAESICLAHIDCDIYEAVKFSYQAVKPFMVPRGYYVFDDPITSTCLGAMEAIEECVIQKDGLHAEQVFPHFVFRHQAEGVVT